jgi:hypothetical protein
VIAISLSGVACANKHVNGTTLPTQQTCDRNWIALVENPTYRIYDLYVGNRLIGSADARSSARIIIDPLLGQVTPRLIEARVTRNDKGPRLLPSALRMVCE